MLSFFSNSLPAIGHIIICTMARRLLGTSLLLQIIQSGQQGAFIFGNALQCAAVDIPGRELLLLGVHNRFQVV